MEYVVEIFIVVYAAYAMLLMALTTIGAKTMLDSLRRNELLGKLKNFSGNPLSEVGISVIVYGDQTARDIRSRLSMDYVMFEVIWIADFNCSAACREMTERYSMVKMPHPDRNYDIYRSRTRRYRKLVLVDYPEGDVHSTLDAALNAASYDYVIALDSRTFLCQAALQQFNTKLSDGTAPLSVDVLCGIRTGLNDGSAVDELMAAAEMLLFVSGYGVYGGRTGITALFDREKLIDAGGFDDQVDWDGKAVRAVRCGKHTSKESWREVMIPGVVAYTLGEMNIQRRNPLSGVGYLHPRFCAAMFAVLVVSIVWTAAEGRHALLIQLSLTAALLLSVHLSIASVTALLLRHRALPDNSLKRTGKFPIEIFIYPFSRIMHIIKTKISLNNK